MSYDPYRRPKTPRYQSPLEPRRQQVMAERQGTTRAIANDVADHQDREDELAKQRQKEMEDAAKAQEDARKEAEKVAREEDARKTRELAEAGAETKTDVATGRRTVATHDDGAVKWKPGPISEPKQKDGKWVQEFRNDRNDVKEEDIAANPQLHKVDEKTGEKFFEGKDAHGRPQRVSLGYDEQKKKQIEVEAKFTKEKAAIAVERDRQTIELQEVDNQYVPALRAKEELDKQHDEHKKALQGMGIPATTEFGRTADGKIGYRTGSGAVIPYDDTKAAQVKVWQERQAALDARKTEQEAALNAIQKRKDDLRLRQNAIQKRESQIEIERAKLKYPDIDDSVLGGLATPENAPALAETNAKMSAAVKGDPEAVVDLAGQERQDAKEVAAVAAAAAPLSVRSRMALLKMTDEERSVYEPVFKDFEANEGQQAENARLALEAATEKMRPAWDALGQTVDGKEKFGDLQTLELLTGKVQRDEKGLIVLPDEEALKARMDANPEFWTEQRRNTAMVALERVKNAGAVLNANTPAYNQTVEASNAAKEAAKEGYKQRMEKAGKAYDASVLEKLIGKPVAMPEATQDAEAKLPSKVSAFGGTVVKGPNGIDVIGREGMIEGSLREDERQYPRWVLSSNRYARNFVEPSAKSGTPVFLRRNQKAVSRDEYLGMLQSAIDTGKMVANAPQDLGARTGYANPQQTAIAELISAKGLDVPSILKKVGSGALSVQQGNSLLSALYKTKEGEPYTIAVLFPDADRIGTEDHFREFLKRRPDLMEDISGLGANADKKKQLIDAYVSDARENNRGNPFFSAAAGRDLRLSMQEKVTDNFWTVTVPETAAQAGASTVGIGVGTAKLLWAGYKTLWGEDLTEDEKKQALLVSAQTKTAQEVLRRNIANLGEGKDNGTNTLGMVARILDNREDDELSPEMQEEVRTLLAKAAREAHEGKMGIGEVGTVEDYDLWNNVTGRALLDEYIATGSDSSFANMRRFLEKNEEMRLVEDAAQAYIGTKADAKGFHRKMQQAYFGGSVAPLQEIGTEVIGDVLMFVGVGASVKTAQGLQKVEATRRATQRAIGMANKIREGVKKARMATYFKAVPGKPLTSFQKAANIAQGAARGALKAGVVEGGEEMLAVTFSEINPDAADFIKSFEEGFIGGVALGIGGTLIASPIQAGLQARAKSQFEAQQLEADAKFAEWYNKKFTGGDVSLNLTPEIARPARLAMAVAVPQIGKHAARVDAMLAYAHDTTKPIEKRTQAAELAGRAATQLGLAENAAAAKIHLAVEASKEIAGHAQGPMLSAVLKLQTGQELTDAENRALGTLKLADGTAPITVTETVNPEGMLVREWKLTDTARAEIARVAPATGQFIATAESTAILENQLERAALEAAGAVAPQQAADPAAPAPQQTAQPLPNPAAKPNWTIAPAVAQGPEATAKAAFDRARALFPELESKTGVKLVFAKDNLMRDEAGNILTNANGSPLVHDVGGGLYYDEGKGEIVIFPQFAVNLSRMKEPGGMDAYADAGLFEEIIHIATYEVAKAMADEAGFQRGTPEHARAANGFLLEVGLELQALRPDLFKASARLYGANANKKLDWENDPIYGAYEFIRQIINLRQGDATTEQALRGVFGASKKITKFVQRLVKILRQWAGKSIAPKTDEAIKRIEAMLDSYRGKTTEDANPQPIAPNEQDAQGPEARQQQQAEAMPVQTVPVAPQGQEDARTDDGGTGGATPAPQAQGEVAPEVSNDTPAAVQIGENGTYRASTPRAGMAVTLARPGPVELDDIQSSAGTQLQPRDRSRPANRHQEQKMAAGWKPERAAAVPTTDSGPVIVSREGDRLVNLSGHGRQNAQRLIYSDPALAETAKANREWIKAEMRRTGYTESEIAAVDSMKAPVWAAEIADLGDYRARYGDNAGLAFVRDSNIYGMSPGELAISDAAILSAHKDGDLLMRLRVSDSGRYTLKQLGNDGALAEILELFGGGNEYTDAAGELTQAFEDRLDNAMLAIALGNQSQDTITQLVEGQEGTVNIRKGIVTAALDLAKLSVAGAFDIGKQIIGPALQELAGFRAAKRAGTVERLSQYLAQQDFTRAEDPRVSRILDAIADGTRNPAQLGETLVEISRDELKKKLEEEAYGGNMLFTPAPEPQTDLESLAAFAGENSDPARVVKAILPALKKMPDNLRQAFARAIVAERERIRAGHFTAADFHRANGTRNPVLVAAHDFIDSVKPEQAQGRIAAFVAKVQELNATVQTYMESRDIPEQHFDRIRDELLIMGSKSSQQFFDFSEDAMRDMEPTAEKPKAKRQPKEKAAKPDPYDTDQDVTDGLSGSVQGMARAVEKYGTVSSIIQRHVSNEIPAWNVRGMVLDSPKDVHASLMAVRSPFFESLKIAVLDDNSKVVHSQIVTVGSLNESIADPKGSFACLMRIRETTGKRYNKILVAHNHPSGNPQPSEADRQMTKRFEKLANTLGFEVVDHVITNGESYFSFREAGLFGVNDGQTVSYPKEQRRKVAESEKSIPAISTPDPQPQANWERVTRSNLPVVDEPQIVAKYTSFLRQGNPTSGHVFYLSTRMTLLGIERIENFMDTAKTTEGRQEVMRRILSGVTREGAYAIILDVGTMNERTFRNEAAPVMREIGALADTARFRFFDTMAYADESFESLSMKELGLMEEPAPYSANPGAAPVGEAMPDLFGDLFPSGAASASAPRARAAKLAQAKPESNADAVRAALDAKGYQFASVIHDPTLPWEARFKNGQVEINAAHVAPEDAVFKAEHELGHALWKDAGFKGQFERLWNALSPGQQQAIDATVEELYSEAGENVRFEEKRVRALELIRKEAAKTEAGRTAWQRFITWLWASISKLTKGKSTTSPEALQQLAASMVEIGRKIVAGNLVRKVSPGVYLANNAAMVEIGGEGKFSIRAYHGTPHKIGPEGFSLTKIGTGEGAQAYGYGLYFAANQNVAETYRKVLTSRQGTSNFADGSTVPTWVASAVQNGRANELRQDFAKRKADAIKAVETKDRQWWLDQANILGFDAILAAIDRLEQGERADQGNLYTVELLAESDEMLDWDKPLSEQSEKVKGALKNVWPKSADPLENVQSGRGLYDTIAFSRGLDAGPSLPGWMSGERISDAQAASAALSSVGIKGIRYLDGSSRGLNGVKLSWRSPQDQARYGTDMALDFADLELSRANGDMAKAIKALKAEHKRSGNPSAKDAAEALEQGAIISKPNAAYNYVIFDDSLVKILEENGEARYSMAEKNSGTNPENGVGSGHGKASGQASNPKGNLRAEQLVARAKGSPVRIEQPEHYGLQGELHGRPWVRERDSSSLSEIDQQEASLEQWAKATGNFIEADELKKVADLADREAKGKEHDVLVFKNANPPFVIRRTKLDMYGMAWATPAEYLQRWRLSNAVFPDTAAAFIGFTRNARGNGVILTAQPYFEGTKKPQKAINAALAKLGFQKIPGDPTSYLNPETKVEIHDAKPDNIIFDKAGNMMPFDVWINDPQNYFQVAPEITPVSPRTPAPSPAESTGPDAGRRKDALERALGELQPIMRKVWTDLLAGKNVDEVAKAAGISVGGVENIIRIVRGKAIALQSVADPARASQVNPNNGRPDLALSTNPMVNAVDAARNLEGSPGYRPRDLVVGEAEARLAANYDGTFQELLSKARKLEPMSDTDVAAVKLILAREAVAGRLDTTERRMALAELIFGYREIGSATARSLAMRFDPHHNPADRAAQYLAEALLSPDPKTSKSLSKAKSAEERQAIMKAWLRRVDGIKTALRREGVDADALLKQHQAVQQAITRADDLNPDAARVYRIQINRLSPQDRAILETARALQVAGQRDMRIVMSRAAAAGAVPIEYAVRRYKQFQAELANEMRAVAAQAARVAAQRAVAPGAPGVTSSEMEILADIGFGSLDDYFDDNGAALPDKKVRKNKNRAAKKQPAGTTRQYEPVPGATPPTGQADQGQLPGMEKPPPQPPPDIYGDYDLTDPAVLRKIANSFGQARGRAIDGIIEFWKASILSGPKTQVVNVLSTASYGFYETFIRNTAEGVLNSILKPFGLGSKDAATVGELAVILAHTHAAAKHAIFNALAAWKTENRIFNDQVLGLPSQLNFDQTKGEKAQRYVADPSTATGRLINLVMTAIRMPSFRLMGMADELLKTFYGHLNASAYAHREAKKAGLKGDAYKAEHARLMAYGSTAWVKARENALRISFQTELMEKNDAISVPFDLVAKGVQYSVGLFPPFQFIIPFIVTPTNLAKSAIELSPAGAFFHIIDGVRALHARYSGDMPEDIRKAAAAAIYDKARFVHDLTQQIIAWSIAYALVGLAGDDDEDGMPFMTGSVPFRGTVSRGERELQQRVMPPMTIRLFGMEIDYSRMDPLASILAACADYAKAVKQGKTGSDLGTTVIAKAFGGLRDKTFLSGIGDLMHAIDDGIANKSGGFGVASYLSRIASGAVPNLIRQPLAQLDDWQRDTREIDGDLSFMDQLAARVGYAVLPGSAPVRLDLWGRPVSKTRQELFGPRSDALLRIFWPGSLSADAAENVLPIDRWMLSYQTRRGEGDPSLAFEQPEKNLRYTIDGKTVVVPMTDEDHRKLIQDIGRTALSALQGTQKEAWSDWKNPDMQKVKMVREVMEEVRDSYRSAMRDKYMPQAVEKARQ